MQLNMITETVSSVFNRLISVKEVADLVGSNERTIYRLAQDGKIPGFKLGGKWIFDKDMISEWLVSQMAKNYSSETI